VPLEKIIEYRVALPVRQALDLIAKVGELGLAMLSPRPPEIPAPHLPSDVYDEIRRVDEIVRDLSKVVTAYSIPHPEKTIHLSFSSFNEMVKYVIDEGTELLQRITQYTTSLESLKTEYSSLSRYLEIVKRVGMVVIPEEFRHLKIDIVTLEPGEVSEFEKAIRLAKGEVMIFNGAQPIAIVVYPYWTSENIQSVYRVFNKQPTAIPREYASREVIESKVKELEEKIETLTRELSDFLHKVRDRIYSVIEVGTSISNISRQLIDKAVPEGKEIQVKLSDLKKSLEEAKRTYENIKLISQVLNYLNSKNIPSLEFVGINYKVLAVTGQLNMEYLAKLTTHIESINDVKLVIIINPPADLKIEEISRDGKVVEIAREYLKDIKTSCSLIDKELKSVESRVHELQTELEAFIKVFNEVSIYGVENVEKAGPDTVTISVLVRTKDTKLFENALANMLTRLAVHAEVRKFSKYMYVPEIPKEKTPTLETYPKLIDVFKKVVYWYGIPKFGEISSTPITFILFPIFYGWMFPDAGHGILIFLLGLLLAKWVYKGPNRILRSIFDGKRFAEWGYIFMQCGIWSIIFTFIESGDIFGIPIATLAKGEVSLYHLIHPLEGGGFVMAMKGIMSTLAWSLVAGIALLAICLIFKIINDVRFGAKNEAIFFGLPYLIGFIGFSFTMICAGLIPLRILTDQIIHIAHEEHVPLIPTDYALKAIASWIVNAGPLVPLPGTVLGAPLKTAGLWITLTIISLIWIIVCGFYAKAKHLHLEEPVSVYAIEGMETYAVWGLANVISFMRLGIIAIVHAVLTALVVWGTMCLMGNPMAFLVSLLPGGIIGYLIFKGAFGKGFGSGFLALCIAGAVLSFVYPDFSVFVCALLGNICVVIFEGLVAFIQSLRLHFYEMFTKYFRAGGTLFIPFKIGSPLIAISIT